ncbi:DNA polymerase beta superfamily protein [Jiangella asiatica]|uniref:Nucleotidyltransferase n=1 Tax=Jiangella asiatica TaxID=2530372 RepID=A0A4V2Z2U1_9ACTN|nr:nucleotidyltransferase domain-containing protein [Jiangella asiatica]TDE10148.1 nucleotidyltransferase [Jiangella asiatica]
MNEPPRVPLGTHVVVTGEAADAAGAGTGRGIAGRIVHDTGGAYTVALVNGRLVDAPGERLMTVGHGSSPPPAPAPTPSPERLVVERTILAAEVGHRSDVIPADGNRPAAVRGVFQAPTDTLWSLSPPAEQVSGPGAGWLSWEVEAFCRLALEGDPTCHELLWSPRTIWVSDAGRELRDLRLAFLSQSIAPRYATSVLEQFKELEQGDQLELGEQLETSERHRSQHRWALAADLVRVLLAGIALLRTGDAVGAVAGHEERLTQVRAGQLPWDQVESWRMEVQQRLEAAAATTFLPAEPDVERVQAWLSDLRRRDLSGTRS